MKSSSLSSESWRTPEEAELLENFRSLVNSGTQWQLWHNSELKGTWWTDKEAQHAAEHLFESLHGTPTDIMWSNNWGGEHNDTYYCNLLVEAPGAVRWMTTPIFIVEVDIASPTACC